MNALLNKQPKKVILDLSENNVTSTLLKVGNASNIDEISSRYVNLVTCMGGKPIIIDLNDDKLKLSLRQQAEVCQYMSENPLSKNIYSLAIAASNDDSQLVNLVVQNMLK